MIFRELILSFVAKRIDATVTRVVEANGRPAVLWHYTRPEAFLKIMEQKTLRGSHIRFMNDSREYMHAIELALAAVRTALEACKTVAGFAFLREFERYIRYGLELSTANVAFVASLSATRDDLSQWRAYGGPEGGVSIGFSIEGLQRCQTLASTQSYLLPVEYDLLEQEQAAENLVSGSVALFEAAVAGADDLSPADFALFLIDRATVLAAFQKDMRFKAENEWRLIRAIDTTTLKDVRFVAKETVISPTLDFDLRDPQTGLMPITEIVVGPGRMSEHSVASIKALLRQQGYAVDDGLTSGLDGVKVASSGVPFRVVG